MGQFVLPEVFPEDVVEPEVVEPYDYDVEVFFKPL